MRKTLIVALAIACLASAFTVPPVVAAGMNGNNLANGRELNGADFGGLSLEGVILPETTE